MHVTDPIADLLTRIRNAGLAGLETVDIPASRLKIDILLLLKEHRWIKDIRLIQDGRQNIAKVYLNLNTKGRSVIRGLERISKPGRRVYVRWKDIPVVRKGLGMAILSTSKGVVDGRQAIAHRIGGELLAKVW